MTGLGKYQKGLELEAEGLGGAAIARKLGYKNTQAWYTAKNYYSKKQEAFNARAAGKPAAMPVGLPKEKKEAPELPPLESEPVPEEWMKDGKQLKRVPRLKQKPHFPPVVLPEEKKPEPKLISLKPLSVNYQGKLGRYSVHQNGVTLSLPIPSPVDFQETEFVLAPEMVHAMLDDLIDLVTVLEVNK